MMTCKGFALIFVAVTCEPSSPAIGKASFCDVMNQKGGKVTVSRKDTRETKERADVLNAQYDALKCGRK